MPLDLQVIHASEFVRLDADEQLDLQASKEALQALAHACHKRGLDRALLDLRTLPIPEKPLFTPTELAALVMTFQEAGFSRQQRLAILYRIDMHGGVRNFAFISRLKGMQVQAFTDFEEGLNWISEAEEASESAQGEVSVRISRPQTKVKKTPVVAAARRRSSAR